MEQVIVDPGFLANLNGLKGPIELLNQAGQTVGVFTPVTKLSEPGEIEEIKKLFNLEEAKQSLARDRDKGRPLAEILARLEAQEAKK